MYTQEEYMYGWLLYLAAYVVVMFAGWMLTAPVKPRELKWLLRVSAGVIFIVPWYAAEGVSYLAPAWLIAGFEGVFDGPEAFWRAGTPLLVCLVLAVSLSLGLQLFLRFRGGKHSDSPAQHPERKQA